MSRKIKGKECRWYRAGDMWVSKDGKTVAMPRKGGGKPKILEVKKCSNGDLYVDHCWHGSIRIDMAVITCYCPPRPADGRYMIHHKDDDPENCNARNLEWVPYHYLHAANDTVKLYLNGRCYDVNRAGTVKLEGKVVEVSDELYDSDMDLTACILPHIVVSQTGSCHSIRIYLDQIMCNAGFIQGDNAGIKYPAILHRDNDWRNYAYDNLEWVEEDDPRYIEYTKKRVKDMHQRCIELNPGKNVPDWWN